MPNINFNLLKNSNFKLFLSTTSLQIPSSFEVNYLPQLDGLRGVAILFVLLSHAVIATDLSYLTFLGALGVQIFFVLSGFLITSLLLKEKLKYGKVSLRNFYIRRILRIVPVAYLFLFVLMTLNYVFQLHLSFLSFLASALYVKNFHLKYNGNWFNGHFWTLSVEEQFYIIFPFLLVYSVKNYVRVVILLIFAIPLWRYLAFHNVGAFYTNLVLHKTLYLLINLLGDGTVSILIGSMISILMFRGLLPRINTNSNRYLGLGLCVNGMIILISGNYFPDYTYLISLLFSLTVAILIYVTLNNENDYLNHFLKAKLLIRLGILSYSIYIWQQIFLYQQPWENSFKCAHSLFINLPLLFMTAYLSYNFFEFKFLKLKDRFKHTNPYNE